MKKIKKSSAHREKYASKEKLVKGKYWWDVICGFPTANQLLLDALRDLVPLYVVRGNNDKEWAEELPAKFAFSIGDVNFFMVHNKNSPLLDMTDDEKIDVAAARIMKRFKPAFEELAK